jgi:hypothetical protein
LASAHFITMDHRVIFSGWIILSGAYVL